MADPNAFKVDLSSLRRQPKDASPAVQELADRVGDSHGFVPRGLQKKRGRPPSPRTGQVHAKVMPDVAAEISQEALRRGVQQGVLIEEAWDLYRAHQGSKNRSST